MDGDQTKDTLDALADLFLTGTIPGGSRPVRVPPPAKSDGENVSDAQQDESDNSDTHSTLGSVADQLDGPESIQLHAKSTPRPQASSVVDERPPVSLRLHRDDDEQDDASEERIDAPVDARVEALFVGNLPGWSGPWLVQYAHYLATQRGPVAVLHVDDDQIEIELVTAARSDLDAIDQVARREEVTAENLFSLLDVLTFNLEAPVATWLVHLPAPAEPRQKARAAQLFCWTVLTGADDTAIAAGHRLLSQLLQKSGQEEPGEATDPAAYTHRVGAMVMGSDEAKSLEAVARFNTASADLLRQPIELLGYRTAMAPVHVKQYGPFIGDTLWSRVAAYLEELDPSQSEAIETAPVDETLTTGVNDESDSHAIDSLESAKVTAEELRALGVTGDDEVEFELTDDSESDEAQSPVSAAVAQSDETAASGGIAETGELTEQTDYESASDDDAKNESEPAVFDQAEAVATPVRQAANSSTLQMTPAGAPKAASAASTAQSAEPDLAAMLADSIGGIALDAKCPRQPDKQIMLDSQGKLHLLRQRIDSDVRGSIVDLIEARDWVSEHIELLALTQRQHKFDADAEPTLHLFADDAKAAVAMVNKLGPSVKLHLVQQVNVAGQGVWVCTDLN